MLKQNTKILKITNTWFIYALPIALLLILAFQYPFSVSVPIGGDAPSHVATALSIRRLVVSPYPLSSFLFTLTRLIPATWLLRFTIFMALGYSISGIMLALVLKKMAGNLAAVIGMIFWSVATWDVLPFYRDGTMAQLWSIPFLLLLFYAFLNKNKKLSIIAFVCIYFAHPATFAMVTLPLVLLAPAFILRKTGLTKKVTIFITIVIATFVALIFIIFPKYFPYANVVEFVQYLSLKDFLETRIGILFICAPLGLIIFYASKNQTGIEKLFLLTFAVLSFFTTFNSLFGVGAWERRFAPYFIIVLIIFGSIGLANIFKTALPQKSLLSAVIILLVFILGSQAWISAQGYYRLFNEVRSSLHKDELTAYQWIKTNLPANAIIAQTLTRGRGIEWLPIFANRQNSIPGYSYRTVKLFANCQTILTELKGLIPRPTFALFYVWTERVPKTFKDNPLIFPLIYKNAEVVIYQLPTDEQNTLDYKNQCQQ